MRQFWEKREMNGNCGENLSQGENSSLRSYVYTCDDSVIVS